MSLKKIVLTVAVLAAPPALATDTFDEQLGKVQSLIDTRLEELGVEIDKLLSTEGSIRNARVNVNFPALPDDANPWAVLFQPTAPEAPLGFEALGPRVTLAQSALTTVILTNSAARCDPGGQSFQDTWSFGYYYACYNRGPYLQIDYYGFAGYSHSLRLTP